MKKHKISIMMILTLCITLFFSMGAFAQKEVDPNAKHFRMVADNNQIRILQNLYQKDISYGELVEQVYPEALSHISEKVLKEMYQTKVNWNNENSEMTQGSSTYSDDSTDKSTRSAYIIVQGIQHYSQIAKGSGYITYNSGSIVVEPYGLQMPIMTVITMLIQDGVGAVASSIDTAENHFQVFAPTPPDPYDYPLSGKVYYTQGSHFGQYLPGSDPATYSINTNTSMIIY